MQKITETVIVSERMTIMELTDTQKLLKECDAGTKMAVSSIDDVLDKVCDQSMKELLMESKSHHEELKRELHEMLQNQGVEEKDPNPMAKSMSWIKTNVKLTMDNSDATIADLLTDGCHMGIKSLYKYLNQYQAADHGSKEICKKLISIEEELDHNLRKYL